MSGKWDKYYQKEQQVTDFNPKNDPSEIQRCYAALSAFPKGDVGDLLDVGCGDGFFCSWVTKKVNNIKSSGVDISIGRLKRARKRYGDITFIEGGFPVLPIENDSYDLVSCIEVLEHMESPVECLRELSRVSRKYILVSVPDREIVPEILCPHCLNTFPASGHLHFFDKSIVEEMVKDAGMELISIHSYYPPIGATTGRIPRWLGIIMRKIYNIIDPRPGSYIVALLKKTDHLENNQFVKYDWSS